MKINNFVKDIYCTKYSMKVHLQLFLPLPDFSLLVLTILCAVFQRMYNIEAILEFILQLKNTQSSYLHHTSAVIASVVQSIHKMLIFFGINRTIEKSLALKQCVIILYFELTHTTVGWFSYKGNTWYHVFLCMKHNIRKATVITYVFPNFSRHMPFRVSLRTLILLH